MLRGGIMMGGTSIVTSSDLVESLIHVSKADVNVDDVKINV